MEPEHDRPEPRPRKRSNALLVALPLVSGLGWILVGGLLSTTPVFNRQVEPTGNLVVTWTKLGPKEAEGLVQNAGTAPVEGPSMYVQFPGGVGGRYVTFPLHTTTNGREHTLSPGQAEPFTVSVREVETLTVPAVLAITNGYSSSEASYRRYAFRQQLAVRPARPQSRRRR